MNYQNILSFWFEELSPDQWFAKDDALDDEIRTRFSEYHSAANKGELYSWRSTAEGRLAEIIVLDQFSRNIFRNTPKAFASDLPALMLAQEMVQLSMDKDIPIQRRAFVYMPYMHSESIIIHKEAMRLFSTKGLEDNLRFEEDHYRIIQLFGRYPHRNEILDRISTSAEIEFLKTHSGY